MDCTKWTFRERFRFIIAFLIIGMIIGTIGVIISHFFKRSHTQAASQTISSAQSKQAIALPPESSAKKTVSTTQRMTETTVIERGDTLASLLHHAGLPNTLWMTLLDLHTVSKYLEQLKVGQPMTITLSPQHQLLTLKYLIDLDKTLSIQYQNGCYYAEIIQLPVTKALRFKTSIIHHSLSQAEQSAGLPLDLQHQLNAMLSTGGAAHDIRPGARLEVLYHEYFVNDERDHPGHIVAAEIKDGTHHYRVVRFAAPHDKASYYTPNGDGTLPAFLRMPLHYERIGSRFNYHRFDPVLHRVQPHLGVDFDAPMGTPVKALSNGVIVFCKQMRGYGNVIMVRYNKTYKSFYAHLEKFARNIRANTRVKKGETIGYVGMTGWTTGPHLHFAVYKNGVAVNPLTVQFPHDSPIPAHYRHAFFNQEDYWFNEMRLFEKAKVANNKKSAVKSNL